MSATHFQAPDLSLRQTVTPRPITVMSLPSDPGKVAVLDPLVYPIVPSALIEACAVVQLIWNPGVARLCAT